MCFLLFSCLAWEHYSYPHLVSAQDHKQCHWMYFILGLASLLREGKQRYKLCLVCKYIYKTVFNQQVIVNFLCICRIGTRTLHPIVSLYLLIFIFSGQFDTIRNNKSGMYAQKWLAFFRCFVDGRCVCVLVWWLMALCHPKPAMLFYLSVGVHAAINTGRITGHRSNKTLSLRLTSRCMSSLCWRAGY